MAMCSCSLQAVPPPRSPPETPRGTPPSKSGIPSLRDNQAAASDLRFSCSKLAGWQLLLLLRLLLLLLRLMQKFDQLHFADLDPYFCYI